MRAACLTVALLAIGCAPAPPEPNDGGAPNDASGDAPPGDASDAGDGSGASDAADADAAEESDAADADAAEESDAADACTADAGDAAEASDAPEDGDASETSDASDAGDAAEIGDASDAGDATASGDASDASDAGDAGDASTCPCLAQLSFAVDCWRATGCADPGPTPPQDYVPPGATLVSTHAVVVDLYATSNPPSFAALYPIYTPFGVTTGAPISSMTPALPSFTRDPRILSYQGSLDGMSGALGQAGSFVDHYHTTDRLRGTFLYGHRAHRNDDTCGELNGRPRRRYDYLVCKGTIAP